MLLPDGRNGARSRGCWGVMGGQGEGVHTSLRILILSLDNNRQLIAQVPFDLDSSKARGVRPNGLWRSKQPAMQPCR